MSTLLNFQNDIKGANAYAPAFATNHFSATLTTGSEQTFTVPTGNFNNYVLSFSYQPGTNVWVAVNTTAAVPAGGTFAATNSELNPSARRVQAADIIHCITDNATAEVGVSIYAIS